MSDELIILPAFFAMLSWIFWVIFNTIRRIRTSKMQANVQTALVEKLGSSQELLTYVQSDAGKRLIESLGVERVQPPGRIIGALQTGVILLPVGLGLLALRGHIAGTQEGFLLFGTLICMLGIGFVLAAGVSYMLTKSLGLLEPPMSQRNN
jgi:hypothetical protein